MEQNRLSSSRSREATESIERLSIGGGGVSHALIFRKGVFPALHHMENGQWDRQKEAAGLSAGRRNGGKTPAEAMRQDSSNPPPAEAGRDIWAKIREG